MRTQQHNPCNMSNDTDYRIIPGPSPVAWWQSQICYPPYPWSSSHCFYANSKGTLHILTRPDRSMTCYGHLQDDIHHMQKKKERKSSNGQGQQSAAAVKICLYPEGISSAGLARCSLLPSRCKCVRVLSIQVSRFTSSSCLEQELKQGLSFWLDPTRANHS